MSRTAPRLRPLARALPIAATAGVLLLAGPAAGSASAKVRHAPCPTGGTTLAKDAYPNVRVWRQGTKLMACTRATGKRRIVRTLGTWTTGTKVVVDEGDVAYTTTSQSDAHGLVDAVSAYDVQAGKRWFSTAHAAIVPDTAAPTTDDRVLRLVVNHSGVAWVSARGIINLAARKLDPDDEYLDIASLPFHVGRQIYLGDAGPAGAAAAAKDVDLGFGGDSDDCGGVSTYHVDVPATPTAPAHQLGYGSESTPVDHDVCNG